MQIEKRAVRKLWRRSEDSPMRRGLKSTGN